MIKTFVISAGLVAMTAVGGMALSMAHDFAFSSGDAVAFAKRAPVAAPAPEGTVEQVALHSAATVETPGTSTRPHNMLAGKSVATASVLAPASSMVPPRRGAAQEAEAAAPAIVFARAPSYSRSTTVVPRVQSTPPAGYVEPVTKARADLAPAPRMLIRQTPNPDYLIGVYR